MIKKELTLNEIRRFRYRKNCPLCGKRIEDYDDFQYTVTPFGKVKIYTFFHSMCLVKQHFEMERDYEKEDVK